MPHAGTESSPLTTTDARGAVERCRSNGPGRRGPGARRAQPLLRPAAIKVILHVPGYLDLKRTEAEALARRLGMRSARPGKRGTALRQRFVMRVIRTVTRRVGAEIGAGRLGVRVRAGQTVEDVVLAFPWVHRTRGRVAGEQFGAVMAGLLDPSRRADEVIEEAAASSWPRPTVPAPASSPPRVPVASVTGTNGKTTTTRLMAHMCMAAGLTTAWSSTDGVVVMGETKEEGDFSGPAGARGVLETPGLDIGILETARGGMLLKGMGVTANDVSVVTNVSADHLGLQGIDTLDQLAEVKAIVTTVTKPQGWVVLNGDDPRVWAMRFGIKAKPWAFSLDPASPALWESINSGGRGITVLDGEIVVLSPNGDPDRLVKIVDVPMTLSGLSRNNIANALAGAAAALGLGVPRSAVVEGLRTFAPDPEHNWGRLNTYSLPLPSGGKATVIMDMAHNEAGLEALLDVARGLAAPGGAVRLGLGCAGDRADEAIIAMGEIAGRAPRRSPSRSPATTCAVARPRTCWASSATGWPRSASSTCPATTPSSRPSRPSSRTRSTATSSRSCATPSAPRSTAGSASTAARSTTHARSGARSSPRAASTSSRPRSRPSGRRDDEQARLAAAQELVDGHPGRPAARLRAGRRQGRDGRRAGRHRSLRGGSGRWPARAAPAPRPAPARVEPARRRARRRGAGPRRRGPRGAAAQHRGAHAPRAGPGRPRSGAPGRADLIRATLEATTDVDTQAYRRALRAYADELAPVTD